MPFKKSASISASVLAALSISAINVNAQSVDAADPDTYARYNAPGQCEQAAYRLTSFYWRDKRRDTVSYGPATDSLPSTAIEAARACVSHFSIETVTGLDLLDLAQVYMITGQYDLASAAVNKLISLDEYRDTELKGWLLLQVAQSYLRNRPAQLERAREHFSQLDQLGDSASLWRVMGRTALSGYAMSVNDISTAISEAEQALNASRTMSKSQRLDGPSTLLGVYSALAEPTSIKEMSGETSLKIFNDAASDILQLRPENSQDYKVLDTRIRNAAYPYTLFGQTGRSIEGDFWFPKQENHPAPGKVTLIVFVNSNCSARCYPSYATLKRLDSRFGDQGLDIVLAGQVAGFFRNHLTAADEEAKSMRHYFLDFLALPGILAVEDRPFSKRPDGRLIRPATANTRNYLKGRNVVLVNKSGVIIPSAILDRSRERTLEAVIANVLKE